MMTKQEVCFGKEGAGERVKQDDQHGRGVGWGEIMRLRRD
jgi:hypothetical protein